MAEERDERLNRELIELLNELRVALPGVQVLFAFLLVVPFSNGWDRAGMTGTVFLITDVLFDSTWAAAIAAAVGGVFGWFWYGLPLARRARS